MYRQREGKIFPESTLHGSIPDGFEPALGRGEGVVGDEDGVMTGLLDRDSVIATQRFAGLFEPEGVNNAPVYMIEEMYVSIRRIRQPIVW